MSEHEIEDLVSSSIVVLGKATRVGDRRVRDLIASLYRFQAEFDCGITYRRVEEILVARGYLHAIPLREHPNAERFPALFDQLDDDDKWCALHEVTRGDDRGLYAFAYPGPSRVAFRAGDCIEVDRATRKTFEVSSHYGVYYDPPDLRFEAGSELWRRLVELGRLTGDAAIAPTALAPTEVAAAIVAEAEHQGDIDTIAQWYPLLPVLAARLHEDAAGLFERPHVRSTFAIIERTRAYERRSTYGFRWIPPESKLAQLCPEPALRDFTRAWFALDWTLPPLRDSAEVLKTVRDTARPRVASGEPAGEILAQAVVTLAELATRDLLVLVMNQVFGYPAPVGERVLDQVIDWSASPPRVDVTAANAAITARPLIDPRERLPKIRRVTEALRTAVAGGERPGNALARALGELGDLVEPKMLRVLFKRAFGSEPHESTALLALIDWSSGHALLDVERADAIIVRRGE